MKRVFFVALLAAAVIVAIWMYLHTPQSKPPVVGPVTVPPMTTPPGTLPNGPLIYEDDISNRDIQWEDSGRAAGLLHVNEAVTGAGNVKVATRQVGEARWVLLLTPGMQKYASLDGTWQLGDFPELATAGFQDPPPPILRGMSIHRSLTRAEMKYSVAAGDRIVVLVCPKEVWDRLNLRWPAK